MTLSESLLRLQSDFLTALAKGECIDGIVARLTEVETTIRQNYTKSPAAYTSITAAAQNLKTISSSLLRLEEHRQCELKHFSTSVDRILNEDESRCRSTSYSPPPPYHTSLPTSPSPTALTKPLDPLRAWFLTHLSYPFPSSSEKTALEALTGLPRKSVEEHLTNWRRRSKWTELMNLYGGGEREGMRELVLAVERGEETRADVLERVEGMRAYLEEREKGRLGEWVKELPSVAKRSRLTFAATPSASNTASNSKKKRNTSGSSTDSASTTTSHVSHTSYASHGTSASISTIENDLLPFPDHDHHGQTQQDAVKENEENEEDSPGAQDPDDEARFLPFSARQQAPLDSSSPTTGAPLNTHAHTATGTYRTSQLRRKRARAVEDEGYPAATFSASTTETSPIAGSERTVSNSSHASVEGLVGCEAQSSAFISSTGRGYSKHKREERDDDDDEETSMLSGSSTRRARVGETGPSESSSTGMEVDVASADQEPQAGFQDIPQGLSAPQQIVFAPSVPLSGCAPEEIHQLGPQAQLQVLQPVPAYAPGPGQYIVDPTTGQVVYAVFIPVAAHPGFPMPDVLQASPSLQGQPMVLQVPQSQSPAQSQHRASPVLQPQVNLIPVQESSPPQPQQQHAIWTTTAPLPMLSHMTAPAPNGWCMPTGCEFRPVMNGWAWAQGAELAQEP